MKNDLNYAEFIERYLDGEMGKDEQIWFENELDANPELQKELELRRNINCAIQEKEVMQLRSQLEEICSSPCKRETTVRKKTVALLGRNGEFLRVCFLLGQSGELSGKKDSNS